MHWPYVLSTAPHRPIVVLPVALPGTAWGTPAAVRSAPGTRIRPLGSGLVHLRGFALRRPLRGSLPLGRACEPGRLVDWPLRGWRFSCPRAALQVTSSAVLAAALRAIARFSFYRVGTTSRGCTW